jgi:hypothetical protein
MASTFKPHRRTSRSASYLENNRPRLGFILKCRLIRSLDSAFFRKDQDDPVYRLQLSVDSPVLRGLVEPLEVGGRQLQLGQGSMHHTGLLFARTTVSATCLPYARRANVIHILLIALWLKLYEHSLQHCATLQCEHQQESTYHLLPQHFEHQIVLVRGKGDHRLPFRIPPTRARSPA